MSLYAVIPAAGKGSRLGLDRPKILAPLTGTETVWTVLSRKLGPFVDCINLVMSPLAKAHFESILASAQGGRPVFISLQQEPRGMGEAIFCGYPVWREAEHILIIWGDQIHVSSRTLEACCATHMAGTGPRVTLPVVQLEQPYVEYRFDGQDQLLAVLESREGKVCSPGGWGDVGTFLLSTQGLLDMWERYRVTMPTGGVTGELNFLPFLVFLAHHGWPITRVPVSDPAEARGINTQQDLDFFRSMYDHRVKDEE
jgi:bifunctional UDP-N-acetylglucosamine pyrophosphorylase / glucosamine-1-phosphate N-acetyltransferase